MAKTIDTSKKVGDATLVTVQFNSPQSRNEMMARLKMEYLDMGWDVEATHFAGQDKVSGYTVIYSLVKYE
jgi:hypothetical protein